MNLPPSLLPPSLLPPSPTTPFVSERKKMSSAKSAKGTKSAFWPTDETLSNEAMPFTPRTITFLYTDAFMKTQLIKLIRESLKESPKRPLPTV